MLFLSIISSSPRGQSHKQRMACRFCRFEERCAKIVDIGLGYNVAIVPSGQTFSSPNNPLAHIISRHPITQVLVVLFLFSEIMNIVQDKNELSCRLRLFLPAIGTPHILLPVRIS